MAKNRGWPGEPRRHGLAARGIPCGARGMHIKPVVRDVRREMVFSWHGMEMAEYVFDQLPGRAFDELGLRQGVDFDVEFSLPTKITFYVFPGKDQLDELEALALRIVAEKEADIEREIEHRGREG